MKCKIRFVIVSISWRIFRHNFISWRAKEIIFDKSVRKILQITFTSVCQKSVFWPTNQVFLTFASAPLSISWHFSKTLSNFKKIGFWGELLKDRFNPKWLIRECSIPYPPYYVVFGHSLILIVINISILNIYMKYSFHAWAMSPVHKLSILMWKNFYFVLIHEEISK